MYFAIFVKIFHILHFRISCPFYGTPSDKHYRNYFHADSQYNHCIPISKSCFLWIAILSKSFLDVLAKYIRHFITIVISKVHGMDSSPAKTIAATILSCSVNFKRFFKQKTTGSIKFSNPMSLFLVQ